MLLYAFLSLVFTAIGVVFISEGIGFEKIQALAVIIFFGLCLLYFIRVLIKGKAALKITSEGIIDNSNFLGAGLVRWEEIERIDFIKFKKQVFLGIYTLDPNLIVDRTSGFKRLLNNLNKVLVETQVNIPVKLLACSKDGLVHEINSRWTIASGVSFSETENMVTLTVATTKD